MQFTKYLQVYNECNLQNIYKCTMNAIYIVLLKSNYTKRKSNKWYLCRIRIVKNNRAQWLTTLDVVFTSHGRC